MIAEDNQKNLESISRIIKRANKTKDFALVFAVCNSLTEQANYIEELKQLSSNEGIVLTEIKLLEMPPLKRLFPIIKEHLGKKFGDTLPDKLGIQVTGFELSILLDTDEQAPGVLQILNMNRESFYKDLPFPFIFWLPEYACVKVANTAPDFWAFRVSTPTFCSNDSTESFLPEKIETGRDITLWQDKQAQIPVLERLLDTPQATGVLVNLLIKSGEAYAYIGKAENARNKFEQAIKENEKDKGDPLRVAQAYNQLGIIYGDLGEGKENLEKAVEFLQKFLEIIKGEGNADLETVGYNHLGLVYDKHKKYRQAIESYEEALKICRKYGLRKVEGDVLGNIGLLYRKQKKYEEALKFHELALAISREQNDIQSEALDLSNIGLINYKQNKHSEAINYFNQALSLNRKTGNKLEEMNQLIHLGDAWKSLGNPSMALENYLSAKSIAGEINVNIFSVLGRMASLVGQGIFSDTAREILLLKEAIEISRNLGKTDMELCYWDKLCNFYREKNEIIEKNNCLMQIEGIIRNQIQQSHNEDELRRYYEELAKIYEELGKKNELTACKQSLSELNERQLIVWFEPGNVAVKNEVSLPILQVGKTYILNFQIVKTLPSYPSIFREKISIIKKQQKIISDSAELPSIEGRRISGEKAISAESTKKIGKEIRKESSQKPIQSSKPNENIPTEQPEITNLIPSPSFSLQPNAVSFHFESPEIIFNKEKIDISLDDNRISNIGSITITPKASGDHLISLNVQIQEFGYINNFSIPLRADIQTMESIKEGKAKTREKIDTTKNFMNKNEQSKKENKMDIEKLVLGTVKGSLSYLLIKNGKLVRSRNISAPTNEVKDFAIASHLSAILLNKFLGNHLDLQGQKVANITMHDKSNDKIILLKQLEDNHNLVFECSKNEVDDAKQSIKELDEKIRKGRTEK